MNEKLLQYFNEIEKNHWWWRGRREILRQYILPKPKMRILDIGCGTGETLSFLQEFLDRPVLHGVDTSKTAINFAIKRGHANITLIDAKQLPFPDKYFDYILLLDVLEHIKDDTEALLEAKRVLKKGGKIIVTAPALQFIWSDHDTDQGHYRRYRRRDFRELSKNTKLPLSKISYFNFLLSPLIIFIRLLGRLSPFRSVNSYDSKLNFEIANKNIVNSLLSRIFVSEIKMLKTVDYPIGISLLAVFSNSQ